MRAKFLQVQKAAITFLINTVNAGANKRASHEASSALSADSSSRLTKRFLERMLENWHRYLAGSYDINVATQYVN